MFRSHEPMPTLSKVVPGGTASLDLPTGLTIDSITFKLTNVTPADLTNFKIKVGAKTIWDLSSAQRIADVNTYYKRGEKSGYLTLWFYRPEYATEEERSLFSLGLKGINNCTVQFKIDGAVTDPQIEAYATRRPQSPLGIITKMQEFPLSAATSGVADIDSIPRGPRIQAFHLFKSDVNHVELKVNNGSGSGSPVDLPKAVLESQQEQHGRSPRTSKATHVDMNLLGKMDTPMVTSELDDMRLRPELGTAGALDVLVEYLDTFDGI